MDPICMMVADLELEPVACVPPGVSLAEAARVLADTRQGVIVVSSEPLGEVSEADVVDALAAGLSPLTHLSDIAHGATQFVRPDTPADAAAAMMIVAGRRSLAVVDEGEPVGAITLRTCVAALWGGKSWLGAFRIALHVQEI